MNILHVCSIFQLGGIKTFVESIIALNETSETSHDLMVIFDDDKNEIQHKCKTYFLGYNRKNYISCIKKAAQIYKKYEAIMIHAAHPVIVFPLLLRRKKCFLFQHGMGLSSGSTLARRIIEKIWYSLIPILLDAKMICSTEFAFNKAKNLGILLQKKRCKIIPFGVIISEQYKNRKNKNSKNAIKVGVAGRLASEKRFDLVLRSLLSYTGKTEIHLNVAGDGPELVYLKKIADDIRDVNVKVDFLGNVENMDVFYEQIDLFLFPSKNESFGLVVLEALTRFIPVAVFSDVGGCLPLIEHRSNGFVLKEGVKGLESLWKLLDENANILHEQSESISKMDFSDYDIVNTRRELDNLVSC